MDMDALPPLGGASLNSPGLTHPTLRSPPPPLASRGKSRSPPANSRRQVAAVCVANASLNPYYCQSGFGAPGSAASPPPWPALATAALAAAAADPRESGAVPPGARAHLDFAGRALTHAVQDAKARRPALRAAFRPLFDRCLIAA